jgi:superfamily I DNA/RNA helicase
MIGHAVAKARKRDYKTSSKVRDNHLDWWLDEIKWIKGRLLLNGQLIREVAEYAAVERTGRGSALQAPARQIVWDVYQAYQSQLLASHKADWDDFARLAFDHYLQLSQAADAWHLAIPDRDQSDHVLVDEAQDLQQVQLLLLTRASRKTLTLVADEAQKIYKTTFSFESLGLHFDRGNVRTLDLSFRSTRQILALAYPLLPAAETAAVQAAPVDGPIPTLYVSPDATQEEAVILHLTAAVTHENPGKTVGVLARSWTELDRLKGLLYSRHAIAAEPLHKKDGSAFTPGVKLTTFHSAKGLEFDVVILARLNDGVMPLDPAHYHTEVSAADYEEFLSFERRLLYVAMTRARYLLAMTCSGTPSRFFQELGPAAYEIVDAKVAAPVPAAAPASEC